MSRLIKKPIEIPKGVEIKIDGNTVIVKGPKGELKQEFLPYVKFEQRDDGLWVLPNTDIVRRKSDHKKIAMFCGTYWSLVRSMVVGVTQGFQKELEIVGVGYRAQLQGKKLVLNLGFAHPVEIEAPEGITFEVPAPNAIVVKGIDKYLVGQVAANIRRWREPIVYSGKGIRYKGEYVRTKVGKKV
ncbi:50S ribosomal protein L6 [Kosmotoga pacifica]|uniref:Large ribosomal subunit protein uL6 n=1 Tax=Kosmotoga pacifica TaxID=1330330 RepID=A0A0G2Z8K2_9BACT|nr:50S ribosomal protein L6 [Kosmotoga pacifica]AKI97902.1 50S ribosomal protein L6 [Kosmotoga pacifica]